MSKVFVCIRDEGSHSDREWEVSAILSSADAAVAWLQAALVNGFCAHSAWKNFEYYPDPYFIEAWNLDGDRGSEDESEDLSRRARKAAKEHPDVLSATERRSAVAQVVEDQRREAARVDVKNARRQALSNQVLASKISLDEYRIAVKELDNAIDANT